MRFYRTSSVKHPLPILILRPRQTRSLWTQTINRKRIRKGSAFVVCFRIVSINYVAPRSKKGRGSGNPRGLTCTPPRSSVRTQRKSTINATPSRNSMYSVHAGLPCGELTSLRSPAHLSWFQAITITAVMISFVTLNHTDTRHTTTAPM